MKLTVAISCIFVLLCPFSADAGGFTEMLNWLAGKPSSSSNSGSGGTAYEDINGPRPSKKPTEQEIAEVNTEILSSAASKGHSLAAGEMEAYAAQLALTLGTLTDAQSDRVFNGS